MLECCKKWWIKDVFRRWLLVAGFAYALFFLQGIPFWDDDFTSWHSKFKDTSFWRLVFEWISPLSTQPEHWGFNERPLQAMLYKLSYFIAGYEAWPYILMKSLAYAALPVMIYQWALRIVPKSSGGTRAALVAALFFALSPGPMASFVLLQDFAPFAELIFLSLTYVIWSEIEKTPTSWSGLPSLRNLEHRRWLIRWSFIAFVTYLGYKSKADVKLVPAVLAAYILLVRRKQVWFFVVPVVLMGLLAIPWGPGIFSKLPPFIVGSRGSEIGWMWQPASFERFWEFIIASDFWETVKHPSLYLQAFASPTLSLAGLLGPFLLIPILAFLAWKKENIGKVDWFGQKRPEDRARAFAFLWFAIILVGVSALPAINYTFRVRYGILTMVPVSLILAWVFGMFADDAQKFPKWVMAAGLLLFTAQAGINLARSINFRRDIGGVVVAVDQVYGRLNQLFPIEKLVLMPDFRPYDYRPDASKIFREKAWLGSDAEISKYSPMSTYVISWKPTWSDQLEMVERFSGCRQTTLFDHVFPCTKGVGAHLMRFIGADPLYAEGEDARSKGLIAEARKAHELYLAKYPLSMAGHFVVGFEALQEKDWLGAERSYSVLEEYFPTHLSILYNRALALSGLGRYDGAIKRLEYVVRTEPTNYGALMNLYFAFVNSGKKKDARGLLVSMKRLFPADAEVSRLLAVP